LSFLTPAVSFSAGTTTGAVPTAYGLTKEEKDKLLKADKKAISDAKKEYNKQLSELKKEIQKQLLAQQKKLNAAKRAETSAKSALSAALRDFANGKTTSQVVDQNSKAYQQAVEARKKEQQTLAAMKDQSKLVLKSFQDSAKKRIAALQQKLKEDQKIAIVPRGSSNIYASRMSDLEHQIADIRAQLAQAQGFNDSLTSELNAALEELLSMQGSIEVESPSSSESEAADSSQNMYAGSNDPVTSGYQPMVGITSTSAF
ncbi:MAG: hypothetical protein KGQ59_04000, partial [Bdellovibrionales bacterium]|nr:hypothetical protein [Bdellovibrionales bacterium]